MGQEVSESIDAAAEYVRYRQTEQEKAELLYTYLTERFRYEAGETATPLYSAICSGTANQSGLANAWQLICNQAGIPCYTVVGMRAGESCTWNIVQLGEEYRHLDLKRCILEDQKLVWRTDEDMTEYYWNSEEYPACVYIPPAIVFMPENPEPSETEEPPQEADEEKTEEMIPELQPEEP